MNPAALARALRDILKEIDNPEATRFAAETVDLIRRVGRANVYPSALSIIEDASQFSAAWDSAPGEGPADVFAQTPQPPAREPDMPRFYSIDSDLQPPSNPVWIVEVLNRVPEGHAVVKVAEISNAYSGSPDTPAVPYDARLYGFRVFVDRRPPSRN